MSRGKPVYKNSSRGAAHIVEIPPAGHGEDFLEFIYRNSDGWIKLICVVTEP